MACKIRRSDWKQSSAERLKLLGLYLLTFIGLGVVSEAYAGLLQPAARPLRDDPVAGLWPEGWPLPVQGLVLFFASDLIYYWIHRAIHRSPLFWRMSGHGFHHAFHNLHALNVNATHPFEFVFLALPMMLLAALFDPPGEAVSAAFVRLACNAPLAHANVSMDTPVLAWIFTHSDRQRRHHPVEYETSNTSFACNAIIRDRLFGTYADGAVEQTGIGPVQPSIRDMFLLPLREPELADTVAMRRRGRRDSPRAR